MVDSSSWQAALDRAASQHGVADVVSDAVENFRNEASMLLATREPKV
jgi:hypothetical protein